MKNLTIKTKKSVAIFALLAFIIAPFTSSVTVAQAVVLPNWNTTGSYVIDMEYLGTMYPHDMTLVQDGMGDLTGNGGSPAGGNVYTWVLIAPSTVAGDAIDFMANYTATPDAVTPQTVLHVVGTVAVGGTMSGTWSDNYAGGDRSGTWASTSGTAVAIAPPVPGEGQIGGDVVGGVGAGTLAVTSVVVDDSSAVADGSFANGWKYTFNVTIPTNETHLSMKFANWTQTGGPGTIAVANNMRISSVQANNAGATVLLTAQNTYSIPTLDMTVDLDAMTEGIQVQVMVEVAVPVGSVSGAYTTSYGVQTI